LKRLLNRITNLPARWKYFKPDAHEAKKKFRDMLKAYSAFIDPMKFGPETASFCNVSNHSKIIMTDRLAYVGSANFSLESQDKYECGVLLSKGRGRRPGSTQVRQHEGSPHAPAPGPKAPGTARR
jgi:phosphatidylserine/phosphatidylglycerophosphate/cardiolipin synthase-like enzyme